MLDGGRTWCVYCLVQYMYARRCEFIVWFSICMQDGVRCVHCLVQYMYARRCKIIVWSSICMLDGVRCVHCLVEYMYARRCEVRSLFGSVYVCWKVGEPPWCVHCLVQYMYARLCEFIVWFSICMLDGVRSLFS